MLHTIRKILQRSRICTKSIFFCLLSFSYRNNLSLKSFCNINITCGDTTVTFGMHVCASFYEHVGKGFLLVSTHQKNNLLYIFTSTVKKKGGAGGTKGIG